MSFLDGIEIRKSPLAAPGQAVLVRRGLAYVHPGTPMTPEALGALEVIIVGPPEDMEWHLEPDEMKP